MCGICGVIQLGGEPRQVVSGDVLDWMTDSMIHRGPNDRGTYLAPGIALGVRRLSIVDVEGGHQPFANEDRSVWAIQNGELYNHVALRKRLRADGHTFRSRCDTEILPHLYERYGEGFADQLRGKFGIAVWDNHGRAVLARDRLGVKPLYWARVDDLVVFGSELKSVLASGIVEPRLDPEALDGYLTFGFTPGPYTLLQGVRKLLPGHRLIVADGSVRTEAYWTYPEPSEPAERLTVHEWGEAFLEELEEAVRLRLMSDVPLGAMLSGGLDSSVIVALMARNMVEPVKTFSVGFAEDMNGNELADARLVARHLGTDHHELELSLNDRAVDLEDLVWHLDEPLADISAIGFLELSRLAASHVTVAQAGQGADELLAGYKKHRAAKLIDGWGRLPAIIRTPVERTALRFKSDSRALRTLAAGDPVTRLIAMSGHFDPQVRARLTFNGRATADGSAAEDAVRRCIGGFEGRALAGTLLIDGQLALVDDMLHYFDRSSMAHSLEVRVPFLDHRVVEFCARVPSALKLKGLTTKFLLKEVAADFLPTRIVHKRKLGFFRPAFDGWFRAQVSGAVSDYLLGPQPRYEELLDRREVQRLVTEHTSGRDTSHLHLLLSILMLEVWLSSYVPRAVSGRSPTRSGVAV